MDGGSVIIILGLVLICGMANIWITNSHLDRMEERIRKIINGEKVDDDDIG